MKTLLALIDKSMKDIEEGKATSDTYDIIKNAVNAVSTIILNLSNYDDFFKIGGFKRIVPLLKCPNAEVVATTAELVADLCQNNTFCQTKALEVGILPELVKQLDMHKETKVRRKSLYALSCLCRNNDESIKCLSRTNAAQVLLKALQEPDEKLRTKTSFLIKHLSDHASFREAFYSCGLIPILIKLIRNQQDSSSEHLLSALSNQVSQHYQSRVQSSSEEYNLLEILQARIKLYNFQEEFQEATEHCKKLLALCFSDALSDSLCEVIKLRKEKLNLQTECDKNLQMKQKFIEELQLNQKALLEKINQLQESAKSSEIVERKLQETLQENNRYVQAISDMEDLQKEMTEFRHKLEEQKQRKLDHLQKDIAEKHKLAIMKKEEEHKNIIASMQLEHQKALEILKSRTIAESQVFFNEAINSVIRKKDLVIEDLQSSITALDTELYTLRQTSQLSEFYPLTDPLTAQMYRLPNFGRRKLENDPEKTYARNRRSPTDSELDVIHM